jgi:monoterpene epsilon-lactone hydrolase
MTSARPRLDDCFRVPAAAIASAAAAAVRRMVGRKRRSGWSARLELWVAATRGAWSQMPTIGIVRWRRVGDTLSPLKFDGLTPRFVRDQWNGRTIEGAWLEPSDADGPVLLYFHGGGFVFGSLRTHGDLIGALARAARARTFALEYRLAPEHPAPAAQEDAVGAYRYLLATGTPPGRIVLAGDSAGGTMVLNTLVALRNAGLPLPAAGVAIAPWVDLACSGASFDTHARFDFVGKEHCLLAAAHYLAGQDPRRPDISPLFADLAGLPPLLVHAGELEVLVDQIHAFTQRAAAQGVDVRLSVYPDMVHVWHLMRVATPEAQRAIDEIGTFVRKLTRESQNPEPQNRTLNSER